MRSTEVLERASLLSTHTIFPHPLIYANRPLVREKRSQNVEFTEVIQIRGTSRTFTGFTRLQIIYSPFFLFVTSHFPGIQLSTSCSNKLLKLSSQEKRTKELSRMHLIFFLAEKNKSPMDLEKKLSVPLKGN